MVSISLNVETLRSDRRRFEHACWHQWICAAAALAARFYNDVDEDDPFSYGETASVGFLGSAAASVGLLVLPEFSVEKIGAWDRRRRSLGRADLWLRHDSGRNWWFEFKQHFVSRGSARDLERKWCAAVRCARQMTNNGVSVAGLIVSFASLKRERPHHLSVARTATYDLGIQRDFFWRIGSADDGPETYILMDIVRTN